MREMAPGARALGPARLAGWRLTFTGDEPDDGFGVPHIDPDDGDEVWGVLWDATEADLRALDDYEGVGLGAYVRDTITVSHDGRDVQAMVYLAVSRGFLKPSKEFLEKLIRGAEANGVPRMYVDRLRAFG